MTLLGDVAIRSSLIVLLGLVLSARLRDRSAALRHCVLAATVFAAALVLPLTLLLPAWDVALPGSVPESTQVAEVRPAETPPAIYGQEAGGPSTTLPVIVLVWAAGCAVSAAVLLSGVLRLVWIASRAERVQGGRWATVASRVAVEYGLTRRVTILQTEASDLLATWGLFRPRVFLPAGAGEWSEERVRVVLYHELAHIRRHDWFVQLSAEVLRAVYWFNPLLWIACTRLRRESEQACDDAVLEAGVSARDYAGHLLALARNCRRPTSTWASAMPMARPSTLEGRIAAMLNPGLNRKALSRRAVAMTAITLLGITLPTAAFRAAQDAPVPLVGSVYDASGALLPQVELTLEDAQQVKLQATTDAAGRFDFGPVAPGQYVLQASLPGFRPLRQEMRLRDARNWDRAITLQVGQVQETIMVEAQRGPAHGASSANRPAAGSVQATPGPVPVKVGGNIRPPRKVHDVKPTYPQSMREAGREGVVPMETVIARDGGVQAVRVLSAQVHPDLAAAAVEAVRQWRFEPTLLNGVPVEVSMTVAVQFRLSE